MHRALAPAFVCASLASFASFAAFAGAAPQWQALPNAPNAERIDGLHFISAKEGWVADANGMIHHTTDGGETWALQLQNSGLYWRCITFADAQRGYVGSLSSTNTLYRTLDGGATWNLVTNIPNPKPNALCGIWAPSSLVAYGVGSYSGPARVIKTTDGGATWTSKDLASQATTLVDVYFWNDNDGIIVGGLGTFPASTRAVVLSTTNGGQTWHQRYLGTRVREWGWKISFPTPDTGYVSLERSSGLPMFLIKTVNRGVTWTEIPFVSENEQGIGFATTQVGWIGGWDNPTYGTTDGGQTWTETPWGVSLDRFQFISPTWGFAAGQTVYRYSEETVAVPPGGPPTKPTLAALPNPFVARTTIQYVLARPGPVTLLIADPTGRIVRRLSDASEEAGPHRVEWDGRDDAGRELPTGIYLYVLHAGEQHEMGKLVRIR